MEELRMRNDEHTTTTFCMRIVIIALILICHIDMTIADQYNDRRRNALVIIGKI